MRVACLQFAPQVGDIDNNLNRADAVLNKANQGDLDDLDLLVLPELAFTGYNFKSLQEISPFLEPSGSGISALWARTTALKYNCNVVLGYPEKVDVTPIWPASPEYYNSALIVNGDGETIANYRKSFLYYIDEKWALEGRDGFFDSYVSGLGNTAMGICSDINPYKLEAPWLAFEFAFHVLQVGANLVILSMAWPTDEDSRMFTRMPHEPDMDTITYWVQRLEPLIRAEHDDEIIVVFCNRTGIEDDLTYAGTSAVIGIKGGEVAVYGLLGRGVKELLIVDTDMPAFAKLVQRTDQELQVQQTGAPSNPSLLLPNRPPVPPPPEIAAELALERVARATPTTRSREKQEDKSSSWMAPPGPEPAGALPALPDKRAERQSASSSRKAAEAPTSSKSPTSSRTKPMSPKIEIPSSAFYSGPPRRRDDASSRAESPSVETPTAPSPTPDHLRPKFDLPTTETKPVHIDTPYPTEDNTEAKPFIYDGSVTVTTDVLTPLTPHLERYRDFSPQDSRYFWGPSRQASQTPLDPSKLVDTGSPISRMRSVLSSSPEANAGVGSQVPARSFRAPAAGNFAAADLQGVSTQPRLPTPITAQPSSQNIGHSRNSSKNHDADRSGAIEVASTDPVPERLKALSHRPRSRSRSGQHDTPVLERAVLERGAFPHTYAATPYPKSSRRPDSKPNDTDEDDRLHSTSRASIPIAASPSLFKTVSQQEQQRKQIEKHRLQQKELQKQEAAAREQKQTIPRPTSRRGHHSYGSPQDLTHKPRSRSLGGDEPSVRRVRVADMVKHSVLTGGNLIPRPQSSTGTGLRDEDPKKSPSALSDPTSSSTTDRPRGRSAGHRGSSKDRNKADKPAGRDTSRTSQRSSHGQQVLADPEDEIIATISRITNGCPVHTHSARGSPIVKSSDGTLYTITVPKRVQGLVEAILPSQPPPQPQPQQQHQQAVDSAVIDSLPRRQSAVW